LNFLRPNSGVVDNETDEVYRTTEVTSDYPLSNASNRSRRTFGPSRNRTRRVPETDLLASLPNYNNEEPPPPVNGKGMRIESVELSQLLGRNSQVILCT
jgi:hypothetical protein